MIKEKFNYKNLIVIFVVTRIIYLLLQVLFSSVLNLNIDNVFYIMDSGNYIHISESGYDSNQFYAFFPFLPILIKILTVYGVVILNNILTFISAILLKELFNENAAILFLLSPIQIFCYVPYTESIFIFLTIISYYLYKKKQHYLLGICLGLGVCCRSMMAMMFFAIFIMMFKDWLKKEIKIFDIFKTFIPATILSCLYPLYLQLTVGKWNYFVEVQYTCWDAEKSNFFETIKNDIINFTYQDVYGKYLIILNYLMFAFLCFVFLKYKEIDKLLIIYTIFSIFIIFSTRKTLYCIPYSMPPSTSYFRYFLACYPMYIALSYLKQKYIRLIFAIFHFLIALNFIVNGWPF